MANNDYGKLSKAQLVERLREAEKSQNNGNLSLKVSQKGGVSVYGLQRMPVTLYKEQWTRLLDIAPTIKAFIEEHDGELSTK